MSDDPKKEQHWITSASAWGGVNLLTVGVTITIIVGAFAQGKIGLSEATASSDKRMSIIERSIVDIAGKFNEIESDLDDMRSKDTTIAVMTYSIENLSGQIQRSTAKIDALQETQRGLISDMQNLARSVDRRE